MRIRVKFKEGIVVREESNLKKIGSITLDILEFITFMGESAITAFYPDEFRKKMKYGEFETKEIFNNLRSMERRGYIEVQRNNKQYSINLTVKGHLKLVEEDNQLANDRCWRIISFDIPEDYRIQRNQFRRSIKRLGYRQIHKSLWVSPYAKADEVDNVINELKIGAYVAFFITDKTNIEKHLKSMFSDVIANHTEPKQK